jgi:DNA polymerase I-like protein with 3'-5' exonuclease and polymerase domains
MNLADIEIISKDIVTIQDAAECLKTIVTLRPRITAIDTETDGLNIKYNKPFLVQFGFLTNDMSKIYTYTCDLEYTSINISRTVNKIINFMVSQAEKLLGHNITYDLHMVRNAEWEQVDFKKCSDTTIYIRLAHDALTAEQGGPPLGLKDYAARFIDSQARNFENKLKVEIKEKRMQVTRQLLQTLRAYPMLEELKITGKERNWTKEMVDKYMDNKLNIPEDLPHPINNIFINAHREYEQCSNYRLLNRKNITEYGHYDIVYTLKIHVRNYPIIVERNQVSVLKREDAAIEGFYLMEQAGQRLDIKYARESKERVRNYILQLRAELNSITGTNLTVGQHEKIKEIFREDHDIDLICSDKFHLTNVLLNEIPTATAKRLAEIIIELRSLEKWYSTYIIKWIRELEMFGGEYVYPTYNQAGAVTGRVSSAFQQFPRDPIVTNTGEILYYPRKMFIAPEGKTIYYMDYNAMELRVQALYTYLVGAGDLNLLRAYVPHKCIQRDGIWYLEEEPNTPWKKTDVHGLTAMLTFNIDRSHPKWDDFRNLGKRGNFAIIYGATGEKIAISLRLSLQQGNDLYNAFFKAYGGIKEYAKYIRNHVNHFGYVENLFQRRYYKVNAHLGKNYAIQGTCADYTKELIPKLVELFRDKDAVLMLYVHDEFGFLIDDKDKDELLPKIKQIMESLDAYVPMVIETKCTTTSWEDKHDIK